MSSGRSAAISNANRLAKLQTSFCVGPRTIGDVDVQAARAGRLDDRLHSQALQPGAHDLRGLDDVAVRRLGNRIEVEVEIVGTIDVVAARVPRVQVDAAEVDDPEQRRQVLDHREIDHAARAVRDRAGLDPLGPRRRRALHEERLAGGAVGIALHHHRPIDQVRQQHRRDVGVVLQQVALGEAELGPERLVEVGQLDFAVAEDDGRILAGRDLHSTALRGGDRRWCTSARPAGRFRGRSSSGFRPRARSLERYAQVLRCTEINSTFKHEHRPSTYARWAATTPPGFRFAVKLPHGITHARRLVGATAAAGALPGRHRRARRPARAAAGAAAGIVRVRAARRRHLLRRPAPPLRRQRRLRAASCRLVRSCRRTDLPALTGSAASAPIRRE